MATVQKSDHSKHGRRLSPEKKAAIPLLYAKLGSKSAVAREIGCAEPTVCYHLNQLPDEQWERIQSEQVKELAKKSVEMLFRVMGLLNPALDDAKLRDLIGAYKQLREGATAFGAIDTRQDTDDSDLNRFLVEARQRETAKAIEEAVRTGSVEGLKSFTTTEQSAEKVPASTS